ncbi:MAG: lysozyme [Lactobacillus sp.]|jgi:lysozyme|nr:lysozyme [Lactobacillus sp.]
MARYHHRATLPALLICLLIAAGLLLFAWHQLRTRTTLPADSNMSTIGVELNQDQGMVDLQLLKKQGVDFVYLRGTQGRSYFDDNYDLYRDQLQGIAMPFGTVVYFSNESTVSQQLVFFNKKIGKEAGELPVMIVPAVSDRSSKFLRAMSHFAACLQKQGQAVLVSDACPAKYLAKGTQRLLTTNRSSQQGYAFWRYTVNGRVKNVDQLQGKTTMFAYLGSSGSFARLYENSLN